MTDSVNERRAYFVYEAGRLAARAANCEVVPPPFEVREAEFQKQFLEVIARECSRENDTMRTAEEMHQSWMESYAKMGWRYGKNYNREKKIHPEFLPWDELSRQSKDKDRVFIELCYIARRWIY